MDPRGAPYRVVCETRQINTTALARRFPVGICRHCRHCSNRRHVLPAEFLRMTTRSVVCAARGGPGLFRHPPRPEGVPKPCPHYAPLWPSAHYTHCAHGIRALFLLWIQSTQRPITKKCVVPTYTGDSARQGDIKAALSLWQHCTWEFLVDERCRRSRGHSGSQEHTSTYIAMNPEVITRCESLDS